MLTLPKQVLQFNINTCITSTSIVEHVEKTAIKLKMTDPQNSFSDILNIY